jgi:centromere protein X
MTEEKPKFRTSTVKALLELSLSEQNGGTKLKLDQNVAEIVAEYLRCIVIEATERSMAVSDGRVIDETNLEKILPQFLLDIS